MSSMKHLAGFILLLGLVNDSSSSLVLLVTCLCPQDAQNLFLSYPYTTIIISFIFWKRRRVCNHIGYIFKFENDLVTHKNYNHIHIWNKFKLELGDEIVLLTRVLSHIIKSQLNMDRSKIITWKFHTNLKKELFKIL